MKAIVAVDRNWGIGRDGGLLVHLPGDLKYFKEKTLGKTVSWVVKPWNPCREVSLCPDGTTSFLPETPVTKLDALCVIRKKIC